VHELSIALSVVELATEQAREAGASRVEAVHLRVGALSGVVSDALRFAFDVACRDTPLAGARLVIEEVPIAVFCPKCRAERTLRAARLRCPVCGTPTPELVRGTELELTVLEVDDNAPAYR